MEWQKWVGKEVFCKTYDSGVCSGIINSYDEKNDQIELTDKYGEKWIISVKSIVKLKEESLTNKFNKLSASET